MEALNLLVKALKNPFEIRKLELAIVIVGTRIAAVLGAVDAFDVDRKKRVEQQGGLQWYFEKREVWKASPSDIHPPFNPLPSSQLLTEVQ